MYEVALSVRECVRSGTHADVTWIVADHGLPSRDKGEALVVTPGGGKIGALLGGALNDQVAALIAEGRTGRLLDVEVDEISALVGGLPSGVKVRCLSASADDFPEGLWDRLWSGKPTCLVSTLDGGLVTGISEYTEVNVAELGEETARFFSKGETDSLVEDRRVITALWPVPRLAIVGGGPICDALEAAARLRRWQVLRFTGAREASPLLMGFGALDMVLVAVHDLDAAGTALGGALSGGAGYIGALGTVQMTEARLDWLTMRGIQGTERIHGPAGLDIGARRPAEVAVAVIAEAMAVRSGRSIIRPAE
jgi:xanthine dehydrogenase accessory factor